MRKEFITAILIAILVITTALSPQSKGVELIEDQLGPDAKIGKQYFVLIAIDRYQKWLPLNNPVRDAEEIRRILESRYYVDTVYTLYNEAATRRNIINLFLRLKKELRPEDSVLIYYSGHGNLDDSSGTGQWIPVDGGADHIDKDNWIQNVEIKGLIGKIESKHILLISDSCFSGKLLDMEKGDKLPVINIDYFRQAYKYRSRQVLTSGALETVSDDSSFALQLKLFLKENNLPFLDPLEMFTNIRQGVKGSQPLLGELKGTGHQKNASFLLFLKQSVEPSKVPPNNDSKKLSNKDKTNKSPKQETKEDEIILILGYQSVGNKMSPRPTINLGKVSKNSNKKISVSIKSKASIFQNFKIEPKGVVANWIDKKDEIEIGPSEQKEATIGLWTGEKQREAGFAISVEGKTIMDISIKFVPVVDEIWKEEKSGPKPSGYKKQYSEWYELSLGKAPNGYTLIADSESYWLTGDRSCGSWAKCRWIVRDDRDVRFAFSLQGHDEGKPYTRESEGHLKAKYKLVQQLPKIEK